MSTATFRFFPLHRNNVMLRYPQHNIVTFGAKEVATGMEQEELISKKDLLLATGISYGQLYRWKRQRLLPDSWFMKMSSYTGQETYFPRKKVLERIGIILELKDTHSLDELADRFEPSGAGRMHSLLDAKEAMQLTASAFDACVRLWGKRGFTFLELLLIDSIAELERMALIGFEEMEEGFAAVRRWTAEGKGPADGEARLVALRKRGVVCFLLLEGKGGLQLDADSELLAARDLSERTHELQRKLSGAMEGWA